MGEGMRVNITLLISGPKGDSLWTLQSKMSEEDIFYQKPAGRQPNKEAPRAAKKNKTKQKNKHTSEVPLHFRFPVASRRDRVKASFQGTVF